MAPFQQTFSVIPELPSAFANGSDTATARSSKPPMTTKQAKKLYKAATKAPKLSKAEQRRQDLMEQDRIRREFEKERNQARAKTARDKKKEKEEKEKDTLARFIRPLKVAKKDEEDPKPPPSPSPPHTAPDDESDDALPANDDQRPMKRQRLAEPVEQATDATTGDQSPSKSPEVKAEEAAPELLTVEAKKASPVVRPSGYAADVMNTEHEVEKCNANESFSADDGLDDDDFSALLVDVTLDLEPDPAKSPVSRQSQLLPKPRDLSEPPESNPLSKEYVPPPADSRETIVSHDSMGSSFQHLDNRRLYFAELPQVSHIILSAPEHGSESGQLGHCHEYGIWHEKTAVSWGFFQTNACREERPPPLPRTIRQPMSTLPNAKPKNPATTPRMAPPPLPPRLQSSTFKSSGLAGCQSKDSPGAANTTSTATMNKHAPIRDKMADDYTLPSSTQLFLLNNLDDLFPSPSQEVQEIFEKPEEDPQPNTIATATISTSTSTFKPPMRRTLPATRMVSSVPPPKPKQIDALRVPLQSHDQCNMGGGDFPFLSTQDFFMSSQDIRELEEDTSSPIKPLKPLGPSAYNQSARENLPPKRNDTRTPVDCSNGQVMRSEVVPEAKTPRLDSQMAVGVQGQLPHLFKAPMSSSSQPSSLPDTPSLPRRNTRAPQSRFIHPRVAPRSSANGPAPDEQRSSSSNPFRFKAPTHGTQRPSQGFQNVKTAPVVELQDAAQSQSRETPRPPPKPFFTSSGTRELTFLAIERSKRTAREDMHARRKTAEELTKQEKSKRLEETTQNEPKVLARENHPPCNHDVDDDDNDYELDEILLASDLVKEPLSDRKAEPHANNAAKYETNSTRSQCRKKPAGLMPAQNRPRSPSEKKPESAAQSKPKGSYEKMLELAARQRDVHDQGGKHIELVSDGSEKENREQDILTASQGTDYGDAAWDMADLDLDSFL
ncbi:hypothetical protein PG994_009018 [Apiospora phragmitis]|uniref:Uncharacterized protein n=1 Tax=Apiospora phragmitis TaxID=2905665 RepID=A0ABR1UI37_9PEZI